MTARPIIRLLTCGSVDDGKSTLIGRLLVETDSVPHDTISSARTVRRAGSIIPAGEIAKLHIFMCSGDVLMGVSFNSGVQAQSYLLDSILLMSNSRHSIDLL